MSSAAERARQKAEARRQRILSKSADRLGVVTGIVAPSILKGDGGGGENSNAVSSSSSFSLTSTTILTNEAAATIITPEPDASTLSTNTTNTTTMRVNTNEEDRDDTNHQISPRSDCDASSVVSSTSGVVTAITAATDNNTSSSADVENESSRGARRMAAMRKRRYQSKTKVVEEEEENVVILEAKVTKVAGGSDAQVDAKANANTHGEDSTTAVINQTESKGSINFDEEQSLVEPTLTNNEDAAGVSSKQKKHQPSVITTTDSLKSSSTHNVIPTIDEKKDEIHDTNTNNNNDDEEHHHNPKKYMGVARIRRQKVKEQRSQRLQAISDADILSGSSPSRSSNAGIDLVRELSAEVATMEITASMVRKGGMVAVLDDTTIGKWASARGLFNSKKRSWKWYSVMLPPMTLVPRLTTLMLLFLAGLDLGTQPYRPSSSVSYYFGYGVDRDFTSAAVMGSSLIGHVEHSLTKPWEYGMGGKVAYTVGITTTSPPTALPTSFLAASDDEYDGSTFFMECGSSDEFGTNGAECVGDYATTNTGSKEKNKNKSAVKKKNNKNNIKLQLMEDEFDSTHTRPRGVVNHHNHQDVAAASEFDDVDLTAPSNYNNIDPLFQIDLDALLHNAHLPLPIDYAAKFAIGFHRTWVHYLWKLPTSLVKTIFGIPMKLLSGWIANPPWILGVVLLIRFVTKVLVGSTSSSGKSFSLDSEHNEDAKGSSSGGGGGGGGGGNLDVMEKIIGAAKNYASSSFPRTSLVFGTLMQVMKVDMYVLLCGMLIGLVMSSMDEKMIGGGSGGEERVGGGRSGMVLGDGEL